MSDIVARLLAAHNDTAPLWPLCREAAAEIGQLHTDYRLLKDDYEAQRAEIERLRAELDTESKRLYVALDVLTGKNSREPM